jgi:YbgC/YbaW family acyl-CoA thioester hydrolase
VKFEKKNIRLLPQDTDAFGIINWRTYVRYCEEGEMGFMDMLGLSFTYFYKKQKVFFPRRAANFEYLAQVALGDLIDIETQLKHIGSTSFTLEHLFYKKNSETSERILAATAEITVVAYDGIIHSKTPLPSELVDTLTRFMSQ